jgi:UrcA family protein
MPISSHTAAALALALCCSTTASHAGTAAQPDPEQAPPSIAVPTIDLDLASARDIRILKNRIRRAVMHVCGIGASEKGWIGYDICYHRTLKGAERQMKIRMHRLDADQD